MSDYLAAGLFIGVMALLYAVFISRFGILARKARAEQRQHEQMRNAGKRASESRVVSQNHSDEDMTSPNGSNNSPSQPRIPGERH